VLFERLNAQRAIRRTLRQQGADPRTLAAADAAISAAERKWQRARPPPRSSNRLRRAEEGHINAQKRVQEASDALRAFEDHVTAERQRLRARHAAAHEHLDSQLEHLEQVKRELASEAPPPLSPGGSRAVVRMLGEAREVHARINGDLGPELHALLDLAQEGSDLHSRLTQVVSRLHDEVDSLGASIGVVGPGEGPPVFHMAERDDAMSEASCSDTRSTHGTLSDDGDSGPHHSPPVPQPVTPVAAPPPGPTAAMADSTKREAPQEGSTTRWTNTGEVPHGPTAWRHGTLRESDGDAYPPPNRRRVAADEVAETLEGST
jgi:hypothetical protein